LPSTASPACAARGLFREDFLRALPVKNAEHPNYYGNFVWVLMMLEQWFQHHAPHARAAA